MIQQLTVSGSHYEIGYSIGQHFAQQIHDAFNNYAFLHELQAYHQTDNGRSRYDKMLALHQSTYPQYLQEMQGIADGSQRIFLDIFLMNLRGEYRGFLTESDDIRGCSDCSILNDDLALMGHNEDGSPAFHEHMYFVHAQVDDGTAFTACSYPGFICGNAFGFNEHGICCSIDNIRPDNIRVGISRQFLARSLLDAQSIDDAIQRVTPDGRASGFSYTIGSIAERRIVQVEVVPESFHIKDIGSVNFHANHILNLPSVRQTTHASSQARVKRAHAILQDKIITQPEDILAVLGDQDNVDYPIYRTARPPDDTETFCTALFDLDEKEMRVYVGHPEQPDEIMCFPVPT